MSIPGYYLKVSNNVEGEPPRLGRLLSHIQLLNLEPGTEILLHSHLHGDNFQERINKARNHGSILTVIRGRRDGTLGHSDIIDPHTGHESDTIVPVGMNHVILLGITSETNGKRGTEPGSKRKRKERALPAWLMSKPVHSHNGRR